MAARSTGAGRPPRIDSTRPTDAREDIASLASFLGATPSRALASEQRPRGVSSRPPRPPLPTLAEGVARRAKNRGWMTLAGGAAALVLIAGAIALHAEYAGGAAAVASATGAAPARTAEAALVSAPASGSDPAPAPTRAAEPAPAPARAAERAPESASTSVPVPLVALAPAIQRPKAAKPVAAAPAADAVPAPSPPPPPAPRPEVAPTGGRIPLHPIVTSNPYGSP